MRVVFVLPLLLLTACGAASPTWMPAGHTWHNDEYKAQPGPEADNLGYAYSADRNSYINSMWSDMARSLVDDLESQTGMSAQPIYVEKLPDANAFNLSLDEALRTELQARGYTLVNGPEEAVHLKYQGFQKQDEGKRAQPVYNGDIPPTKTWKPENAREFVFVLTLLNNGAAFGEVRRTHVMPAFGYVAGEGNLVPAPRVMEGSGQ